MREETSRESAINFLKDLSAGGMSGIVAKTVTAPIERVKLLMQTQGGNADLKVQLSVDCYETDFDVDVS